MDGIGMGWFVLLVVGQVVVFGLLIFLAVKLIAVIKAQNNGVVLPPDVSARLRRLFKKGPKTK